MNTKILTFAIIFIANYGVYQAAVAQSINATRPAFNSPAAPPQDCPTAKTMKAAQLYGLWKVVFVTPPAGLPTSATLQLERHAEFSDSLAGTVSRKIDVASGSAALAGHAAQAFLAGDLEDGLLLLDESSDNLSITGTWNGEIVKNSCGKAFVGTWKDTSRSAPDNTPDVLFTLTRLH